MSNTWQDGILGVAVGDALGRPVEFMDRAEIAERQNGFVKDMEANGTFHQPAGTWTDDTSMTLALLQSLVDKKRVDFADIMDNLAAWVYEAKFTATDYVFDVGITSRVAIDNYAVRHMDPMACGRRDEHANGNGSLMRIMPAVLYAIDRKLSDEQAVCEIDDIGALTHNHARAKMACGIYYFMAKAILDRSTETIGECLQKGMDAAKAFYAGQSEWQHYAHLEDIEAYSRTDIGNVRSGGYVVESLGATVWCLAGSTSYAEGVLKGINLGHDTDTTAAIAGGLAGLYYGKEGIPQKWLQVLKKVDMLEDLCDRAASTEWDV